MASHLKIEERKVWISKSVTGLFGVLNFDDRVQYAWYLKQFLKKSKLRTLVKKVWEVDPLLCPQCHHERKERHGTGPIESLRSGGDGLRLKLVCSRASTRNYRNRKYVGALATDDVRPHDHSNHSDRPSLHHHFALHRASRLCVANFGDGAGSGRDRRAQHSRDRRR